MENQNFQNTTDIKLQSTAEIRLQDTGSMRAVSENGDDNFSEKTTKKEKIISIIACVVVAFILWLIIANINASTPSTLPLRDDGVTSVLHLAE